MAARTNNGESGNRELYGFQRHLESKMDTSNVGGGVRDHFKVLAGIP